MKIAFTLRVHAIFASVLETLSVGTWIYSTPLHLCAWAPFILYSYVYIYNGSVKCSLIEVDWAKGSRDFETLRSSDPPDDILRGFAPNDDRRINDIRRIIHIEQGTTWQKKTSGYIYGQYHPSGLVKLAHRYRRGIIEGRYFFISFFPLQGRARRKGEIRVQIDTSLRKCK